MKKESKFRWLRWFWDQGRIKGLSGLEFMVLMRMWDKASDRHVLTKGLPLRSLWVSHATLAKDLHRTGNPDRIAKAIEKLVARRLIRVVTARKGKFRPPEYCLAMTLKRKGERVPQSNRRSSS